MAEVTNEELSIQIAGLGHKLRIVDGGWLPSTEWLRGKLAPLDLLADMKSKIEDIHKEVVKAKKVEILEQLGMDHLAAAYKKLTEEGWSAARDYFIAAVASTVVPLIGGALVLILSAWALKASRGIQERIFRGFVLARTESGLGIWPQRRTDVEAREANTGGVLNTAHIPDAATLDALKLALADLNPKITAFNTAIRKVPRAGSLTKTADGITRVKTAVTGLDTDKITALAKALGKLTGAVKHHDPKKVPDPGKIDKLNAAMAGANPAAIREMATATGKLASAQRHFDPKKLPKARGLESAARAANKLADAGRDVAQAFNNLKIKAQEAAQAMA
ncbi:hypothetical protein [Streptomyces nymphaeiformis]|uniref:Uncharacterized protein n=1 Tax=Streptomyces nymphaeiformis TaxID=2663842 RepID=A0A7W7U4Z3_9ACTN|nr:hypothetical protein [Streptomyces nymphaeiformis]MBB4983655.1 hypothetical protein [Streptomyces nymphaeiformis]